jgi:hypothetical protein
LLARPEFILRRDNIQHQHPLRIETGLFTAFLTDTVFEEQAIATTTFEGLHNEFWLV